MPSIEHSTDFGSVRANGKSGRRIESELPFCAMRMNRIESNRIDSSAIASHSCMMFTMCSGVLLRVLQIQNKTQISEILFYSPINKYNLSFI